MRSPCGTASGVGGQDLGEEVRVGVADLLGELPGDSSCCRLTGLISSGSSQRLLAFSFSASTSRSEDFSMSISASREEFWSEGGPSCPSSPASILQLVGMRSGKLSEMNDQESIEINMYKMNKQYLV